MSKLSRTAVEEVEMSEFSNQSRKLDVIFEKEPKQIQEQLMRLLLNYDANMQYNHRDDHFQVDIFLPFQDPRTREQFVQRFLRVRQSGKAKAEIKLESSAKLPEKEQALKKAPFIPEKRIPMDAPPIPHIIQEKELNEPKQYNLKSHVHELNYENISKILDFRIDKALNSIAQQRHTHEAVLGSQQPLSSKEKAEAELIRPLTQVSRNSHSESSEMLILEESDKQPLQSFLNASPGRNRQSNYEMSSNDIAGDSYSIPEQADEEEGVQETVKHDGVLRFDDYSQQYQQSKKSQNKVEVNRLKKSFTNDLKPPRESPLQQKYDQFIRSHNHSLDLICQQIRKDLSQSKRNAKKKIKEGVKEGDKEGVKEDRVFQEKMVKQYRRRVLALNSNMSSEELVRYFRYLLVNARKLYNKHYGGK